MATQLKVTVKPSGGDYTSLAAAITANAKNLITADQYLTIEIDGDWSGGPDTSVVDIAGYTTDDTHYIEIYTTPAARHNGVYDTSKYRLEASNDVSGALIVNNGAGHIFMEGLQIKNTYASNAFDESHGVRIFNEDLSSYVLYMEKCIVYAPQHAFRGLYDTNVYLRSSIFISTGASGHNTGRALFTAGHVSASNCIFANTSASSSSPTVQSEFYNCPIKNCYSYNAGSGASYGAALTLTTCASDDATGTAGLQSVAYSTSSGAFFTSLTPGAENFTLKAGSVLIGAGTDLSASFTEDIIGEDQTVPWEVGCFTYALLSSSSSSCSSSKSSSSSRSSSSSSSCRSSSSSSCRSSSSSCSSRSSSSSSRSSSSSSCRSSSSSSCRSSSSSSSSRQSSSSSSSSSSCRSSSSSSSSSRSSSSSSRSSSSSSSSCRSSSSCSSSSSAIGGTTKTYSREDLTALPAGVTDLLNIFSGGEYVQAQFVDGVRVAQPAIKTYACFLFKDRYTSDIPFTVTWVGRSNKAATVFPIVLQIYNRNTTTWETLASNNTAAANTDVTLSGTKLSTIADYFDVNHEIVCRVYQQVS